VTGVWHNLNRLGSFQAFSAVSREIDYFSEYLRTNVAGGGEDLQRLDRSAVTGFATYLVALVETKAVRHRGRRNTRQRPAAWNKTIQWNCLLMVQRILRYGRETGRMDDISGSFMVTDDVLIRRPRPNADDETGEAIPTSLLRQLFSQCALNALRTLHPQMPLIVRLAAETGRRPTEVLSLMYDCIDTTSTGGPFLIYTETKVTGGEVRKLPVLSIVVDVVREAQKEARARYLNTPLEGLRLFPRIHHESERVPPHRPYDIVQVLHQMDPGASATRLH
jgi:integrase